MEKSIQLKNVEVGKKYWVLNGHWTFTVISKTEKNITIKCEETDYQYDINYNSLLIIEEKTRLGSYVLPENTLVQIVKQDKLDKLDQEKYSTNKVIEILREYREHAWINGVTLYSLEEWIVKKFNLDRGEHFSKNK